MAEARNDGDEELPNVSITRRRDSTGRTIIITVTITYLSIQIKDSVVSHHLTF